MQKHKKTLALLAMLSLIATNGFFNGFIQVANAASLTQAKDLITSSNMSAVATHTITFTIHASLTGADTVQVVMPGGGSGFGDFVAGNVTCTGGAGFNAGTHPSANTGACVPTGLIATGTVVTMTIGNVANPSVAGSQTLNVTTTKGEHADVMVAIISNVAVSVTVPSTLLFVISPLATGTVVNKSTTTAASATTSIAFGSLQIGTSSTMGQQLEVTTNANYGYQVTVEQNQNLTSNSGTQISSFKDNTAVTAAWSAPSGILDATTTYGHMGVTSNDWTLAAGDTFNATSSTPYFSGFNGTTPMPVLYHTGPADGLTLSKGMAQVAYRIQISPLQAAGDYYNTLTYIATPTY